MADVLDAQQHNSTSRWRSTRVLLMFVCILALAAVVRLTQLGSVNYWFDEAFSIRLAQFSNRELLARSAQDTHPPLYFLMLKGWIGLWGTDRWETRLLSVIWSLGVVGCAFGFVYEAVRCQEKDAHSQSPELAACLSGVILALSPLQITWAQQVRMYAPLACLTLLSTWLMWRAVEAPQRWGRWTVFSLSAIALLYTHVTSVFVWAAQVLSLVYATFHARNTASRSAILRGGLISITVVMLAFAPWVLHLLAQNSRVQGDFWSKPFELSMLSSALLKCFTVSDTEVTDPAWGLWVGQVVLIALLALMIRGQAFDISVAAVAGIPALGLIAASLLGKSLMTERYFISGCTMTLVAASVLVCRAPKASLRLVLALALIGGHAALTTTYFEWRERAARAPGLRGLIAAWRDLREPGEPLVFSNPMPYVTANIMIANVDVEVVNSFSIFGTLARYPFFVGTAVVSENEFLTAASIDHQDWESIWTCDPVSQEAFLPAIELSDQWMLVAEQTFVEFNGELRLRRFQRRHPVSTKSDPDSVSHSHIQRRRLD